MGKHQNTCKNHENGSRKAPRSALGTNGAPPLNGDPPPESILSRFWLPFGVHFGSRVAPISGSFFVYFSGTLLEHFRAVLGGIWEPFGVLLAPFLVYFWDPLTKWKLCSRLDGNTIFDLRRLPEAYFFRTPFRDRSQSTPKSIFFQKSGDLGSILESPGDSIFCLFWYLFSRLFLGRKLTPGTPQNLGSVTWWRVLWGHHKSTLFDLTGENTYGKTPFGDHRLFRGG